MSHRMTPVDAAWLRMEQPTNLMIITSVLLLSEVPTRDRLLELLQERLVDRYPRFRQRAVEHAVGLPTWEDDPGFDIRLHLQRVALPAPGDDAALQEFVSEVMSQDLDRRRPLWHAWLVEGWGAGAAVVFRIHHCVADGISLASVLLSTTDGGVVVPPPAADTHHHRIADLLGDTLHAAADTLTHPLRLLDAAKTGAGIVESLLHDTFMAPDPPTAFKGEQSAAKVAAWSAGVPLSTVKATARAHGATVNDVLLSALAGALGAYLAEAGTPVPQIRAVVPVSLRPRDEPVPTDLGNNFALVFCPLPVGVADPAARLEAVKDAMDHIKGSEEAITSLGLLTSMGLSPDVIEDLLVRFFGAKSSLVCTNVPGPRQQLRLDGIPIVGLLSWAPTSGPVTISGTIVSYDGVVRVGVMADAALVPDPDRIVASFEAAVQDLAPV